VKTKDKTILFSGRFDKPHLGHLITIKKLGQEYKKVLIVILDYPDSAYSIAKRMRIMNEALEHIDGNYEVTSNKTHFAKVTKEELNKFKFDVYGAGNEEVLKHIGSLGIKCVDVPRHPDYAASDDVKYQKILKILES
jgi:nicotinamide mononucleotide adenylyltransferase